MFLVSILVPIDSSIDFNLSLPMMLIEPSALIGNT
jgi:hypothetical protein